MVFVTIKIKTRIEKRISEEKIFLKKHIEFSKRVENLNAFFSTANILNIVKRQTLHFRKPFFNAASYLSYSKLVKWTVSIKQYFKDS